MNMNLPIPHAVLDHARQRPRRSQAHEFVGFCSREDVPPAELEQVLQRRKAQAGPYPTRSADWTFPDGSAVRVWPNGRSLRRPLVHLETQDGGELVQRWWIWWKAIWSCSERVLETEPRVDFVPSGPGADGDGRFHLAEIDAFRIVVNGRRVGELVFDTELRLWFLDAGILLPPGGGGWLRFATPRSQFEARRRLAQGLLRLQDESHDGKTRPRAHGGGAAG